MPDTIRTRCGQHASVAQAIRNLRGAARGGRPAAACRAPSRGAASSATTSTPSRRSTGTSSPRWRSTLGVILFAVVDGDRAVAHAHAHRGRRWRRAQSEINDLREERDRATRCCISEPQVIVVWPAGADEPEITGDVSLVDAHRRAAPRARLRHLARARQGAADGGRGRCAARRGQELLADARRRCTSATSRRRAAPSAAARCCASRT